MMIKENGLDDCLILLTGSTPNDAITIQLAILNIVGQFVIR